MELNQHEEIIIDAFLTYFETQDFDKFKEKADDLKGVDLEKIIVPITYYWYNDYTEPLILKNMSSEIKERLIKNENKIKNNSDLRKKMCEYSYYNLGINAKTLYNFSKDSKKLILSFGGELEKDIPNVPMLKSPYQEDKINGEIDVDKNSLPSWLSTVFIDSVKEVKNNRFDGDFIPDLTNFNLKLVEKIEKNGDWSGKNILDENAKPLSGINIYLNSIPNLETIDDSLHDEIKSVFKTHFKGIITHELAHAMQGFDIEQYKYYTKKENGKFTNGFNPIHWARISEIIAELNALLRGRIFDYKFLRDKYNKYNEHYMEPEMDELLKYKHHFGYYSSCFKNSKYDPLKKAIEDIKIMTGKEISTFKPITNEKEIKKILLDNKRGRKTNLWNKFIKEEDIRFSDHELEKDTKIDFSKFSSGIMSGEIVVPKDKNES